MDTGKVSAVAYAVELAKILGMNGEVKFKPEVIPDQLPQSNLTQRQQEDYAKATDVVNGYYNNSLTKSQEIALQQVELEKAHTEQVNLLKAAGYQEDAVAV